MGKGEIARYEQFLLFPQCFQKAYFPGASKGVIEWEWVKKIQERDHGKQYLNCLGLYTVLSIWHLFPPLSLLKAWLSHRPHHNSFLMICTFADNRNEDLSIWMKKKKNVCVWKFRKHGKRRNYCAVAIPSFTKILSLVQSESWLVSDLKRKHILSTTGCWLWP